MHADARIDTQNLVPGSKLNPSEEDDSIPIMLIQRSIGPEYADKENKDRSSKNSMFGWTLIVPTGWGTAFWHSLAFADARVGGLRERSQQFFEAGCPSFPEDFACTSAFKSEIEQKAKDMSARWMRTPPAKRVNYKKLQTTSPWKPAFSDIVHCLAKTIDTQQKTEAEVAGTGSATMEVDEDWRAWMPWGNGTPPFELSGPIVSKILTAVVQHMQDCENMPRGALKTQDSLDGLIKSIRTRRVLPTPREDPEVITTFVKVRLEPVSRGSPKYNAMIYSLEGEEYAAFVQSSRKSQGGAKGTKRTVKAAMQIDANTEANGEKEPEEDDENDENEPIPAVERIIGYVTTGNMSLARGRGQGLGAVNLVHLANVIAQQSKAK
jgi:ribonuclease P/MRP protein subunit POP1